MPSVTGTRIAALNALTAAQVDVANDLLPIVDVSETTEAPTGKTKRITAGNLLQAGGVVNVKNYGAVGDGTTDDTTAIQAALNTGKDVYVPRVSDPTTQYYKITSALTMSSNQRLFGDGWGSLIRVSGSTVNAIEADTKNLALIDGLHIYAGGGRSNGADGCGVFFTDCTKSWDCCRKVDDAAAYSSTKAAFCWVSWSRSLTA